MPFSVYSLTGIRVSFAPMLQNKIADKPAIRVIFVVPPKVHLLDLAGPAHLFYEASAAGANIVLAYTSMQETRAEASSSGLAFASLQSHTELRLKKEDIIFVPGLESALLSDKEFLFSVKPFLHWLREQYKEGVIIAAVCTGAFLLAEAGLLNGKECTTHGRYLQSFRQRYEEATAHSNRLFVKCGTVYTSAGVSSGIDLALYMLEERFGSHFTSAIAREVVIYFRRGTGDPQLSPFLQHRNHLEERVHSVQEWMSGHLQEKCSLEKLAELAHTSPRHLSRLFKEATGITIGQYLEKLRLERAVQLLGEKHKVEAVTQACGLKSPNQLRHLLKKHRGRLPSNYAPLSG